MSRDYAESRIREALRLSRGNPTKARAQIIAWAGEDQRLLMGLAQPHLTGIVAHAVNRVIYLQSMEETAEQEPIPARPQPLNMPPDTFGRQILSALSSGSTAVFGQDRGVTSHPKKASQSHIDAIKQMASKNSTDKR